MQRTFDEESNLINEQLLELKIIDINCYLLINFV
jgi:hypothetical protein